MIRVAALAAAHALLFALAFPQADLWPLMFFAIAPLGWLAYGDERLRHVLLAVLGMSFLAWLWTDRWLVHVTVLGYPLHALYMAAFPVAFVAIVRALKRWPATLIMPVAWVALECLRGEFLFYGYAWYFAGHPMPAVLAQSADLVGVYGLSFMVVLCGGLVVDVAWKRAIVPAAVTVGVVYAANLGYGLWRLGQDTTSPGPTVLAIQTNLPQDNKIGWTVEQQVVDVERFAQLTADAVRAGGGPPDLLVWPETMLPGLGLEDDTINTLLRAGSAEPKYFRDIAEALVAAIGAPMLAGSPVYVGFRAGVTDWEWDSHHNSAYLITGDRPYERYDKVVLTPFGEVLPYFELWPWLESKVLALGARGMRFELDSGEEVRTLTMPDGLVFGTPICFEDASASLCRRMVNDGAAFLVNISNDGWVTTNDAARWHHVQVARFRCIENRVPMARAVNTGLTVPIDSAGRLIGEPAPTRSEGWVRAELPLDSRSTVYGRLGDVWGWACVVVLAIFAAVRRWGRSL